MKKEHDREDNLGDDAEAEEQFSGLVNKYHRLARLAGARHSNYQHSPLIYIIHVILTGRRAPHASLQTVAEKTAYLQEVLQLEAQDASTLTALYLEAVRQRPVDFPHINHLLDSARQKLAEAGVDSWHSTPPVSTKVH